MDNLNRLLKFFLLLLPCILLHHCTSDNDDIIPANVTSDNALESYVKRSDPVYQWEIQNSYSLLGVSVHEILLTSQKWQGIIWTHQLTVLVPAVTQYNDALLWITGGRNVEGMPKWTGTDDGETLIFSLLATKNQAVVAVLRQTPNQPLFDNLKEDELIAYTLHQFQNDGDYSWPLLFPMVKGAVRAMDAVQEFSKDELGKTINGFLVSGGSKRGWTTWLTGAVDQRVEAIAPAVIDMLNMPVSLDYHLEVWGAYSPQIQDYVDLGIPQQVHTEFGGEMVKMIDPYSYRESLTMPKMIFIGTNDPYWPVDAIKHYFKDLPGQNFIHYVPNAGHGLNGGEDAINSISAFFGQMLTNNSYPVCAWSVNETVEGISIEVNTSASELIGAYMWSAVSSDRDFRDETWSVESLDAVGKDPVVLQVEYPASGFMAFYVDLEYPSPTGGNYTKSSRMFVCDEDELFLY
jgi:PhoPQ-activated pathogenicity-related protein